MKIAILLTGDELMTGDTLDSNSSYLAQSLKPLGLVPYIKCTVGDDIHLIVSYLRQLSATSDVLIVNGGLGPTSDDLTAQALAEMAEVSLMEHPQALLHLEQWAEISKIALSASNLKQAYLPENCEVIPNPYGSAVGFSYMVNQCEIICTPGVPSEFKPMVEQHVVTRIQQKMANNGAYQITRLRVFGFTESGLQESMNALFPNWPDEVVVGYRVHMPLIEVKIITREAVCTSLGLDFKELNAAWTQRFLDEFADYVVGYDDTSMARSVLRELNNSEKTLVTVESCTGGLIASHITRESGCSSAFVGGFVAYANEFKSACIQVNPSDIHNAGAVSETVAKQMVQGGLRQSGADIAVAVTGVAGPDGGSDDKPVGTVWIAWGDSNNVRARCFHFRGSRQKVQRTAAAVAMDLVRRSLMELDTELRYFCELKK